MKKRPKDLTAKLAALAFTLLACTAQPSIADELSDAQERADKAIEDILSEFGMGKNDLPPEPRIEVTRAIPTERWIYQESPHGNQFVAASQASELSPTLDSAILQIDCLKGREVGESPYLRVSFLYWKAGRAFDGDGYGMDVFNSSGSGRPGGFNLGNGRISTADIEFNSLKRGVRPDAYTARINDFYEDLSLKPASIEIYFEDDGSDFSARFSSRDLSDALQQMHRFCPIANGPA